VTLGSGEDASPQSEPDGQAGSDGDRYVFSASARHVAAVLRRMIVGGELPDGVKLPRQQDLLAQFGVSMPSLREALSVLEAEGLVTVQGQNRGGAIVHSPDATGAALTIGLVLESRRTSLVDVGEANARVQFECADLCAIAEDRAERIVPVLEGINKRGMEVIDDSSDIFVDASLEFHSAIVDLSENHSLALVAGALRILWDSHAARVATTIEVERFTRSDRLADVRTHQAVTSAIEKGDRDLVRKILTTHMRAALEFWSHIEGPSLIDVTSDGLEALRSVVRPQLEMRET
jgi:GntR family transcriptional repressor for pyruvate dehydrogenase complex